MVQIKRLILIVVFSFFIGFFVSQLWFGNDFLNPLIDNYTKTIKNPGILYFLKHNLSIVLLISVLPYVNLFLLISQSFSLGLQAGMIHEFPLVMQFQLLYRHLVFELIALILSVYISYFWVLFFKEAHQRNVDYLRDNIWVILRYYLYIILLILFAALMEGSINA